MTDYHDPRPGPDTTAQRTASRAPLRRSVVEEVLAARGAFPHLTLVDSCPSTNTMAMELSPTLLDEHGWALVASDEQTAGKGRLGRHWASPKGAGLWFSLALPIGLGTPPSTVGLLPLAAGAAVAEQCRTVGVPAAVKWPNDIVIDRAESFAKLGGLLAERTDSVAVVGVGVNVDLTEDEAPTADAASLRAWGLPEVMGREELLGRLAAAVHRNWLAVSEGEQARVLAGYRDVCATLGRRVRAQRPDGTSWEGVAVDLDDDGHLLLESDGGALKVITAADIVHLRPA